MMNLQNAPDGVMSARPALVRRKEWFKSSKGPISLLLAGLVALVFATGAFAGSAQPRANGGCYGGPNLPLDTGVAGITTAFSTCALSRNWLNRNFVDVVANGIT